MRTCIVCVVSMVALAVGVVPEAIAAAQRSFVSSTGSDANACSLAAPCRSFGAAIAQTNAGGEVIVLDSAGYGPVTITKGISLIAPAGVHAGITATSGNGITVNAPGAIVLLRGLTINGQGGSFGIQLADAQLLIVERCEVAGMLSVGLAHASPNAQLIVRDTTLRRNLIGVHIFADGNAQLDRVRAEYNASDGVYVQAATSTLGVAITDSAFSMNGDSGIHTEGTVNGRLRLTIDRSSFSGNSADGVVVNGGGVTNSQAIVAVSASAFERNGSTGVAVVAAGPGFAVATVSDSTFAGDGAVGILADGAAARVRAVRNSGFADFCGMNQANGAVFVTNGDNNFFGDICGTITAAGGQ